jgi:hypothetical protein
MKIKLTIKNKPKLILRKKKYKIVIPKKREVNFKKVA